VPLTPQEREAIATLVSGNTAFAVALYRELAAEAGNVCFSPYSLSSVLSMTYAGARENTATQMKGTLHFELEQPQLHSTFKVLNRELANAARKTNQKLTIANGIWLTGKDVSPDFKNLVQKNYDAEIFDGDVDDINKWVKDKTEGKLEKIIDTLDPNAAFILLNTLYFKGVWADPFSRHQTYKDAFQLRSAEPIFTDFMHQTETRKLFSAKDFQAIELPYQGNLMSMVVILPHEVDGLAALEAQLTDESLHQWLTELDHALHSEVRVSMPKFTLQTGYDLVPACKKLGIHDAFAMGNADFRGMRTPDVPWISMLNFGTCTSRFSCETLCK
jgi:serpin B